MYYIIESTKIKKRYKCPYCELRDTRDRLISHIEKNHEDLIPKEYTATRIVFNMINKKDHGNCIICKKETKWDDDKERYDSFCSEKCKDEYVKIARARNMKIYGKENLLNDAEHQIKMLMGRKISGYYKFTSGGKLPYIGSYEKNFLEFIDVFLHIKIKDIIPDFPILKYNWNDSEHFFIPDFYYAPYNLVIDIKDGGDNPNTRQMDDYRNKQIAKEKSIKDNKEYNYIRLTDNNFTQLIEIFMELKELSLSNSNDKIVKINEVVGSNPIIGMNKNMQEYKSPNTVYLILANKNGLSSKIGVSKDKTLFSSIFTNENYNLEFKPITYLNNTLYRIFEYTDNNVDYKYSKLLESINTDNIITDKDIYTYFTGKDLLDFNQLFFDENLMECASLPEELKIMESSIIATLLSDDIIIPMIESTSEENILEYAQDLNGYYIYNKDTSLRSISYEKINSIPEKVKYFISIGKL